MLFPKYALALSRRPHQLISQLNNGMQTTQRHGWQCLNSINSHDMTIVKQMIEIIREEKSLLTDLMQVVFRNEK